jgi:hypothetical protein
MIKNTKQRAISTIVSTGILLSSVAIMGSMLTAWSNSMFVNEQNEINTVYAEGVNKLNEFLLVEHVWFGNETGIQNKFINLTMSNVGNVGLNVTKITLDNSIDKTDKIITNGGILPDDDFSRVIPYNWTSIDPIQITVTTERNSIYQTLVMGP